MLGPGWCPEDDDRPSEDLTFGEALAKLADDETPAAVAVETVRESRKDV